MRTRARLVPLAVAAALGGAIVTGTATPASAADYPSWSEVQQARSNASAKAREVAKVQGLLADSRAAARRTERIAEQRGADYQARREQVDAADADLQAIKKQVKSAERSARRAVQRAGLLAAQLARTGGADPRATLLLEGGASGADADAFLDKLGRLNRLAQSNGAISAEAEQAKNTVAATADRARAAEDELVRLRKAAQRAYDAAVQANDAANAQLQKQQRLQAVLTAQLAVLRSRSATTLADYRRGLAAASASVGAGVAGDVMPSGWALPASGPITDPFGPRPDRPAGANSFHRGTDIGGGCSSPIYAAHEGTVVYAGWYGTYGNFIEISHGSGVSTGYAHIRPGGTFVHVGQHVSAGQNIASIGTTGASTGCHLHFEVRLNEVAIDSVPFMAARGVTIG